MDALPVCSRRFMAIPRSHMARSRDWSTRILGCELFILWAPTIFMQYITQQGNRSTSEDAISAH